MKTKTTIVIVGGGFAGVKCAQTLSRALPRAEAEIILFNAENHLVFTPLLADVIGASVNPLDVVVPLRQLLPGVHCRTEEITGVSTTRQEIEFEGSQGAATRLKFDHLVLACGSVANLHAVPGMADHAFPLRTIGDAVALRSHVMAQMERAESCDDPERRRWHLSFIVVGAGFSGVEAAGEINDLVRSSARYFQRFTYGDVSVTLVHARDQILPEVASGLRDFARRTMERAGVQIRLDARVASASALGVALEGGEFIRGGTIVCTVGSAPAPVLERLGVPKEKGRLVTDADLRVRGTTNVWALGDCAWIVNEADGRPAPPTGQFAERQGQQCALNLVRVLRGEATRPFSFRPFGQLCSLGGRSAVAEFRGLQVSGVLAWLLWRGVYLFKLPSWARRCQVGFDWAWQLFFPRDLAHIRARPTDRVTHAWYQPGDLIHRAGDALAGFYAIETGEVELLRNGGGTRPEEVVHVLGPGAFFGEQALQGDTALDLTVRARTPVRLLLMGRNVFTQISAALAPLRDAVAETLNRRSVDLWKVHPTARAVLEGLPIRALMDGVPSPLFAPTDTLADLGRAFAHSDQEVFYVCGEGQSLEGVVTMTDWMRALARGATPGTPVVEIMLRHPVTIEADEDGGTAARLIREHRLKHLPVVAGRGSRRLVGCLHTRRLLARVLDPLGPSPARLAGSRAAAVPCPRPAFMPSCKTLTHDVALSMTHSSTN